MQKYLTLLLIITVAVSSCKKDPVELENTLHYDGENANSPNLFADTYEMAVRFTESKLSPFTGKTITSVEWYLTEAPDNLSLRIYDMGNTARPGDVMYNADVSSTMKVGEWNSHTLSTPIEITTNDIWISLRFTLSDTQQSIGCDSGPNRTNGDWIFRSSSNDWDSYLRITGGESVNWNIRGIVSE